MAPWQASARLAKPPCDRETSRHDGVHTVLGVVTSDFCRLGSSAGITWAPPSELGWGTGTVTGCRDADQAFPHRGTADLGGRNLWSEAGF